LSIKLKAEVTVKARIAWRMVAIYRVYRPQLTSKKFFDMLIHQRWLFVLIAGLSGLGFAFVSIILIWNIAAVAQNGDSINILGIDIQDFIKWLPNRPESLDSRSISSVLVLTSSLFVLYLVWFYRDKNHLRNIENARKDTNLKDFHQQQQWISGSFDSSNNEGKLSLRVSALYNISGFLSGDYGNNFKRPAFEYIKTAITQTTHVSDDYLFPFDLELFDNNSKRNYLSKSLSIDEIKIIRSDLADAKLFQSYFTKKLIAFVKENHINIFKTPYPITGIHCNFSNLSLISLPKSQLRESKFIMSDFNYTFLDGSIIAFSDFSFSNLSLSSLNGIDAESALFVGTVFSQSSINDADFRHAIAPNANFSEAVMDMLYARGSSMQFANFYKVTSRYSDFSSSTLKSCQFSNSILVHSDFSKSELQGANFYKADLKEALFRTSVLCGANLQNAKLSQCDFTESNLTGADISGADLSGANLVDCNLQDIFFDDLSKFDNVKVSESTLASITDMKLIEILKIQAN
jgi:uncharacterized protein YjbI with pentapeptide repeats